MSRRYTKYNSELLISAKFFTFFISNEKLSKLILSDSFKIIPLVFDNLINLLKLEAKNDLLIFFPLH